MDISEAMVTRARRRDPDGDYRVIEDGDFSALPAGGFDVVYSAFTFGTGGDRRVTVMGASARNVRT